MQVHNNNIESAIRVFKRKIDDAGIMDTLRNGRYYEKPSSIKRERKKKQVFKYKIAQQQEDAAKTLRNRSKRRKRK